MLTISKRFLLVAVLAAATCTITLAKPLSNQELDTFITAAAQHYHESLQETLDRHTDKEVHDDFVGFIRESIPVDPATRAAYKAQTAQMSSLLPVIRYQTMSSMIKQFQLFADSYQTSCSHLAAATDAQLTMHAHKLAANITEVLNKAEQKIGSEGVQELFAFSTDIAQLTKLTFRPAVEDLLQELLPAHSQGTDFVRSAAIALLDATDLLGNAVQKAYQNPHASNEQRATFLAQALTQAIKRYCQHAAEVQAMSREEIAAGMIHLKSFVTASANIAFDAVELALKSYIPMMFDIVETQESEAKQAFVKFQDTCSNILAVLYANHKESLSPLLRAQLGAYKGNHEALELWRNLTVRMQKLLPLLSQLSDGQIRQTPTSLIATEAQQRFSQKVIELLA